MKGTLNFSDKDVREIVRSELAKSLPGKTRITDITGTGYNGSLKVDITDEPEEVGGLPDIGEDEE